MCEAISSRLAFRIDSEKNTDSCKPELSLWASCSVPTERVHNIALEQAKGPRMFYDMQTRAVPLARLRLAITFVDSILSLANDKPSLSITYETLPGGAFEHSSLRSPSECAPCHSHRHKFDLAFRLVHISMATMKSFM